MAVSPGGRDQRSDPCTGRPLGTRHLEHLSVEHLIGLELLPDRLGHASDAAYLRDYPDGPDAEAMRAYR